MTEEQLKDTKERILTAARALFSAKGYDGTSVRDIARDARVNVAAVNYHFQGKANLFQQVINGVFMETSATIKGRRDAVPDEPVEDFAIWIFGNFLSNGDVLRAIFKMMLSETGLEEEVACAGGEEEPYGPPGGRAMAEAIRRAVGHEVPEADMYWAVKVIFSNVVHMSLMYTNHLCHLTPEEAPFHDRKTLESDIRRLVRVVLKDL